MVKIRTGLIWSGTSGFVHWWLSILFCGLRSRDSPMQAENHHRNQAELRDGQGSRSTIPPDNQKPLKPGFKLHLTDQFGKISHPKVQSGKDTLAIHFLAVVSSFQPVLQFQGGVWSLPEPLSILHRLQIRVGGVLLRVSQEIKCESIGRHWLNWHEFHPQDLLVELQAGLRIADACGDLSNDKVLCQERCAVPGGWNHWIAGHGSH